MFPLKQAMMMTKKEARSPSPSMTTNRSHLTSRGCALVVYTCTILMILLLSGGGLELKWLGFVHPPSENNNQQHHLHFIMGCSAQGQQEQGGNSSSKSAIFADDEGHLHMQTAANTSLYVNDVDVTTFIAEQQQQLVKQLSINAVLKSTIASLNATLSQLPCHAFHPPLVPFDYDVSILDQGVYVDYQSNELLVGSGSRKWVTPIVASNGMVYAAPDSASTVLLINPATNQVDTTSISVSNPLGYGWYGSVMADSGKLYFVPYRADNVLIIDPNNNNNAVDQTSIAGLGVGFKWHGGAKAPNNNKIYCVPYDPTSILIIDPADDTADTTTIVNLPGETSKWYGAVLAANGLIYGIPFNYNYLLIINPMDDTADASVAVESGNQKWLDGLLANNGKIYAIPSDMPKVLVIDPSSNNAISYIDVVVATSNFKWWGGVLTAKGKVIGVPHNSNIILIIDPDTDIVDILSLTVPSTSQKWVGGVFVPQYNRIYTAPFSNTYALQIDLDPCM